MPDIAAWEHRTVARVPADGWQEAWYSLVSWRGYLQSLPGSLAVRLAARRLPSGDVEVHVATLWEHRAQLARWLEGPFLPRRIFAELSGGGEVVDEAVLESFV